MHQAVNATKIGGSDAGAAPDEDSSPEHCNNAINNIGKKRQIYIHNHPFLCSFSSRHAIGDISETSFQCDNMRVGVW